MISFSIFWRPHEIKDLGPHSCLHYTAAVLSRFQKVKTKVIWRETVINSVFGMFYRIMVLGYEFQSQRNQEPLSHYLMLDNMLNPLSLSFFTSSFINVSWGLNEKMNGKCLLSQWAKWLPTAMTANLIALRGEHFVFSLETQILSISSHHDKKGSFKTMMGSSYYYATQIFPVLIP